MLAAGAVLGPTLKTQADLVDRIRAMEDDQAAFGRELERLYQSSASTLDSIPGSISRKP